MRSLLSTATEAASVRLQPSGSLAQFSTTRYRCSPEPRIAGMCFSPSDILLAGVLQRPVRRTRGICAWHVSSRLAPDVLRRDDPLAQRQAHQFDVGGDTELGADL